MEKKKRMALCIVVFFARKFNVSIQLFLDFAFRCYGDVMNKNGMILGCSNLLIVTKDVVFKHS